ncbi:MAG: hypothetical protein P4L40_16715 [Terracidiphilus sp.]|nr:hypothetical protein [Terracidiphilus sp.]
MTTEISLDNVPSFPRVREQLDAIAQDVVFEKARIDEADNYVLRLRRSPSKHTNLRLSMELLTDLAGKHSKDRESELRLKIREAVDRLQ